MNSRAWVEGLAFVERILPLSWEQKSRACAVGADASGWISSGRPVFFWEREARPELRSDVEGGGSRVLAKREEAV